jgi:hypothetical protein
MKGIEKYDVGLFPFLTVVKPSFTYRHYLDIQHATSL